MANDSNPFPRVFPSTSLFELRLGVRLYQDLEEIAAIEKTNVASLIVAALTDYCTEEISGVVIVPPLDESLPSSNDQDRVARHAEQGIPVKLELDEALALNLQLLTDIKKVDKAGILKLALQRWAQRRVERGEE